MTRAPCACMRTSSARPILQCAYIVIGSDRQLCAAGGQTWWAAHRGPILSMTAHAKCAGSTEGGQKVGLASDSAGHCVLVMVCYKLDFENWPVRARRGSRLQDIVFVTAKRRKHGVSERTGSSCGIKWLQACNLINL